MKNVSQSKIAVIVVCSCLVALLAYSWTPLSARQDRLVFMPGPQPGSANLESAGRCDNCHGGYNRAVEPAHD